MNFALVRLGRTFAASCERLRNPGGCANPDMNVAGLRNAANVGPVRRVGTQVPFRHCFFAEGFKECIGKLIRAERRIGERRNGSFNLKGVHRDIHGSTILIPHPSKSFRLRVEMAAPWDRAMAAIWQSGKLIARPAARRSARIAANS